MAIRLGNTHVHSHSHRHTHLITSLSHRHQVSGNTDSITEIANLRARALSGVGTRPQGQTRSSSSLHMNGAQFQLTSLYSGITPVAVQRCVVIFFSRGGSCITPPRIIITSVEITRVTRAALIHSTFGLINTLPDFINNSSFKIVFLV